MIISVGAVSRGLALTAGAAAGILVVATAIALASRDREGATNVILLVGDGMAESELTVARNYVGGAAGARLALDGMPVVGDQATSSRLERSPDLPDYVSDSAAAATALSTGQKTSDGRVSTLPGATEPGDDPATIVELAEAAGLRTGIVTTSRLTDATPAAAMSHVPSRICEGPAEMSSCGTYRKSRGGPGSIAEQSIDQGVDVLLGGGSSQYDQATEAGPTVAEDAATAGYEVVRTREEVQRSGARERVLGLLDGGDSAQGNLATEWAGEPATNPASGGARGQRCNEANPERPPTEPSLAEMTEKALSLLSEDGGAGNGFFLEVEGSSIDKAAHLAQPCQQIGELLAFDRAVAAALEFARRDGETLVIVTGDHAHSSQIVNADEAAAEPPGCSSRLLTKEGAPMMVTYGTDERCPDRGGRSLSKPISEQHTGAQLRVTAEGPQAERFAGLTDNTSTFEIVTSALGIP